MKTMQLIKTVIVLSVVIGCLGAVNVDAQENGCEGCEAFLSCFYECVTYGTYDPYWTESTVLFLANQHLPLKDGTLIIFLDGNAHGLVRTNVCLDRLDVDAINVCETIRRAGYKVPASGMIQVRLGETSSRTEMVSGWIKNFLGSILKAYDDPMQAGHYIKGIGKTNCWLMNKPNGYKGNFEWLEWVPPVYVSGTGEPNGCEPD